MNIRYLKFFILFVLFCFITRCKNSAMVNSDNLDDKHKYPDLFETINLAPIDQSNTDWDKITYLEKVGEISEGFSNEEENFFAGITDLCVDKENYIYVADSKLHKIFKFDSSGNFIFSFGRTGQGSSEFLGRLRINQGHNNKLYITDDRNSKLCLFTIEGEFINEFNLPRYKSDDVAVNSKGNIFLLSESGLKVIDHFDSELKYCSSLLDIKYCLDFPYEVPERKFLLRMSMRPTIMEVHKLMTEDSQLVIVFNNSQIVTCFNENLELAYQFRIDHSRLIEDYKKRIREAKKKNAWINCFGSIFLDEMKNINICYFNSELSIPEIYRYRIDGKFVDTIRLKNINSKTNNIVNAKDKTGNYYGIDLQGLKIIIYREVG